jgi:TRAP-type C4-dicarboxylate transport system substrate-binding protein
MARVFKDLPEEVRQVVYELACEMGYEQDSSIEKINYKFFEDIEPQDLVYKLAEKIVEISNQKIELYDKEYHERFKNGFFMGMREAYSNMSDEAMKHYSSVTNTMEKENMIEYDPR